MSTAPYCEHSLCIWFCEDQRGIDIMPIRFAGVEDSRACLQIYSQYIDTPITFEYTLPDVSAFSDRIRQVTAIYPWLVYEENGQIWGYTYAHRQMEREAYQWNAELTVYLDQRYTSRGIGKQLYSVLLTLLKHMGIQTVYAGVTLPNEKSVGLHKSLGFRMTGIYYRTGYKCGKWHDVAWFEKALSVGYPTPQPILPLPEADPEKLKMFLRGQAVSSDGLWKKADD